MSNIRLVQNVLTKQKTHGISCLQSKIKVEGKSPNLEPKYWKTDIEET